MGFERLRHVIMIDVSYLNATRVGIFYIDGKCKS